MTADTETGDGGQTIAELRRMLAEREAERDAATAREAAMAEVVALINASPADPQPVFDAILEHAHRLLGASIGTLWTYDGAYIRGVATHGHPEDVASYIRAERWPPVESVDRLIKGERFFQIEDLRVIYYEPGTIMRMLAERSAVRTMLLVPLRRNGQFIGHITAFRTEVRPYAEPEIALLERFAAQAVIAIENARLLGTLRQQTDDLRESLDYQTAISDVLRVISRSTFDLGPVLETLLSAAARLCDADLGGIATVEGDGVRVAAHYSRDGSYRSTTLGQLLPLTRSSILGRTALEGRVIHVEDVGADPGHVSPDANTPRVTGTMLGVPLLRDGIVLGSIRLARATVKPFTQRQIDLVSTFADQAVIAIENARLLGALRERTDELAERNDAFAERIDHQAATIDVLEAMSASPDDPQPVFDLIADQARTLCGGVHVGLFEFDGTLVHCRAAVFADSSPDVVAAYRASFPMPADQDPKAPPKINRIAECDVP